ncbi:hypothetical protein Rsub_11785 [Raphidocelis subcapitata]|uniref:Uncharacterized protein n=1 Tax=Raphidocelis subcapitata TaxID=307507 RepID=A0A2V0PMX8_9CHLO|nr:hypothetical protein Rsub_11785 [Raphidocelis subcapitata]|eukprot:GBF99260.1 hypothetical protein Rsub_11785 [Raphidocelis subcapitata]
MLPRPTVRPRGRFGASGALQKAPQPARAPRLQRARRPAPAESAPNPAAAVTAAEACLAPYVDVPAPPSVREPLWCEREAGGRPVELRRRILCNRSLNMRHVRAIGFDMDYTIAQYKPKAFEELAYRETVAKLVRAFGYPPSLFDLGFDHRFMMRGLIVDKKRGNIIKIDRHKYVKLAYHGFRALRSDERDAVYNRAAVRDEYDEPDYAMVDTLFSLAESHLFSQLVELADKDPSSLPHGRAYQLIWRDLEAELRAAQERASELQNTVSRLEATAVVLNSGGSSEQRAAAAAVLDQLRAGERQRLEELQWQLTVHKSHKAAAVRDRDALSRMVAFLARAVAGGDGAEGAARGGAGAAPAPVRAARLRRALSLESADLYTAWQAPDSGGADSPRRSLLSLDGTLAAGGALLIPPPLARGGIQSWGSIGAQAAEAPGPEGAGAGRGGGGSGRVLPGALMRAVEAVSSHEARGRQLKEAVALFGEINAALEEYRAQQRDSDLEWRLSMVTADRNLLEAANAKLESEAAARAAEVAQLRAEAAALRSRLAAGPPRSGAASGNTTPRAEAGGFGGGGGGGSQHGSQNGRLAAANMAREAALRTSPAPEAPRGAAGHVRTGSVGSLALAGAPGASPRARAAALLSSQAAWTDALQSKIATGSTPAITPRRRAELLAALRTGPPGSLLLATGASRIPTPPGSGPSSGRSSTAGRSGGGAGGASTPPPAPRGSGGDRDRVCDVAPLQPQQPGFVDEWRLSSGPIVRPSWAEGGGGGVPAAASTGPSTGDTR